MEKGNYKIQAIMFSIIIVAAVIAVIFYWFVFDGNFLFFQMGNPAVLIISFVVSVVIAIIFSSLMAKRTAKGAETEWKIRGFKLFIETAEKYRAQFYEKENMFEKILPYAIAFGLTKKWIEKMRSIYGDDKFLAMAPVWYVSSGSFNADAFTSSMNNVSSAIASSVSSSSGSNGSGGAGGGGGGGGGGGW